MKIYKQITLEMIQKDIRYLPIPFGMKIAS